MARKVYILDLLSMASAATDGCPRQYKLDQQAPAIIQIDQPIAAHQLAQAQPASAC